MLKTQRTLGDWSSVKNTENIGLMGSVKNTENIGLTGAVLKHREHWVDGQC